MSARNNLIVPQGFTAYQAEHISRPDLFERLTNQEAKAAKLEYIGLAGKFRIWKRIELSLVRASKHVAKGRILQPTRENGFPRTLCDLMASEMALRPSWSLQEA